MQIILDTRGLQFSVRNKCFYIEGAAASRIVHPSRVSSILITAPCRISSPALVLAAQSQVPVTICNNWGKPEARIWSPHYLNISTLRRKQYVFTIGEKALDWAFNVIDLKIEGQLNNMAYISDRKSSLAEEFKKSAGEIHCQVDQLQARQTRMIPSGKKEILFVEAFAASRYWQLIGKKLPEPFVFSKRIKPHATDTSNSCINYLYGMLRNHVETSVLSFGLDPALGVIHRDGYKLPSLVFDMMEPFRPVIDRFFLEAVLNSDISPDLCEMSGTDLLLTKKGRKQIITLFNEKIKSRIRYRGSVNTVRNHILTEVRYLIDRIKSE